MTSVTIASICSSFHLSFCQRQFGCHVVERFYCLHELSNAVVTGDIQSLALGFTSLIGSQMTDS